MSSLFEISKEFNELFDLADQIEYDEDGEIIDNSKELTELFNGVSIELGNKLDSANYIIKQLKADSDTLKAEAKRLNAKAKAKENNALRLKELMLIAFKASGEIKIKNKFTFSVRKTESVSIANEDELSREYMKIVKTPDKVKIKKELKDGVLVDGCSLSVNESLNIR